jgi:hypothetical protein
MATAGMLESGELSEYHIGFQMFILMHEINLGYFRGLATTSQ